MTRTRMVESTAEVVPGLATGYLPREGGGFVRAAHGFPLGGEGGLVSCVEDLALWERNYATGRVGGAALMEALQAQAPFANGRLNKYARGLEVATYRGLRRVDHGGLWPGFKTAFLRLPERDLAVIAIANHGGIDVSHLAHQALDAAVESEAGVHPVPPMPPRAALERLPGRWLDRASGMTLEFSLDADGEPAARMHGVPFALAPTPDGRLAARRGAFELVIAPPEGDTLAVELDAGVTARFDRLEGGAMLPADLAGRYACEEIGAVWRLAPEGDGLAVRVEGPLVQAGPWRVEPIAGDHIRIHATSVLFPVWFDVLTLRDAAGRVTGLRVDGARARGLVFVRE
jgi:hypothetical protein